MKTRQRRAQRTIRRARIGAGMALVASLIACDGRVEPMPEVADTPATGLHDQPFDAQAEFDSRCAHCHDGSVAKAPHLIEFQIMGASSIQASMTDGLMTPHAQGLTVSQIAAVASHLGGETPATVPARMCDTRILEAAAPATSGWTLTEQGTRFIPESVAQLDTADIGQLTLKWVFAYPGATRARSQPVPYGNAILVGSQSGIIYALDLESGCAHWTFEADVEVRSALAIDEHGVRAYFGDIKGTVYAIDPRDGTEIWRAKADAHPNITITGSPRLYRDRLYVPLSSTEWGRAADPGYSCCTFRGGVAAFAASDGTKLWSAYAIPAEPQPTGKVNESGAPLYHAAGAPVWNSPTIDAKRNLLYVGTGEAYTSPAADTSDSVLAIDLQSGDIVWHYQSISGDAWNMACFIGGGANCPEQNGPDLDIGAAPMLMTVDGRDLVVAGQKSGHVFALRPDDGSEVWRKKIGRGGFAGGIHWGMAANADTVFAPNADTVFTGRFKGPRKPGLFALNAADGEIMWHTPAPNVCDPADQPACDPGLSAAVTAIPGAVFAGAFDGHLRAYNADTGAILWDFNTHQEFTSVSGEIARGGSIEADGPVVYRSRVLINSGYLFGDRMAGNALLVFGLP